MALFHSYLSVRFQETQFKGVEYRCIANNTCGNKSTTMFIDVQCKIIQIAFFDTS